MNVFEFLATHRSVFETIQALPAKPSDVKYIELVQGLYEADTGRA